MKRTRTWILIAGASLILLANAAVLGLVAWNRSGEPESVLRMTGREVQPPYDSGRYREDSGLRTTLRWRTLGTDTAPARGLSYFGVGGRPQWLDAAKLAALGFPVRPDAGTILPREVLLVLEYDGPTYRLALQRARERAAREDALQAASPGNQQAAQRAKLAREALAREESTASRLFVVDAGLDAAQLRSKYPDRGHYAIVRGEVRAQWVQRDGSGNAEPSLVADVSGIHADRINVPHALRSYFAPERGKQQEDWSGRQARRETTVAFGRRLEPWIVTVAQR